MSDDDLIRRGDVLREIEASSDETRPVAASRRWLVGSGSVCKYIRALPAAEPSPPDVKRATDWICPQCAAVVAVDEDGCCGACGATAFSSRAPWYVETLENARGEPSPRYKAAREVADAALVLDRVVRDRKLGFGDADERITALDRADKAMRAYRALAEETP